FCALAGRAGVTAAAIRSEQAPGPAARGRCAVGDSGCAGAGTCTQGRRNISPGAERFVGAVAGRGQSVARMERSVIRESSRRTCQAVPDFASLHPGYATPLRGRLVAREFGLVEFELFGDRLCDAGAGTQPLVI